MTIQEPSRTADRVRRGRAAVRQHDGLLRAVITDLGEEAERSADALDASSGGPRGPLRGLPVAVKDNIDVAGTPTTAGRPGPGSVAAADASVIRSLRTAEAVVMSKTNLHELAFGATTQNPHHGTCRNPWDPDRLAGGSSGGSAAAVAAGMCEVALGTDTGGSVRIPAALTGCTGLRPTTGSVSSRGVVPLSPRFDVVGPIARRVDALIDVMAVIAGFDHADATSRRRPPLPAASQTVSGLRLGVHEPFFFTSADTAVADAVMDAVEVLADMGGTVSAVTLDGADLAQAQMIPLFYSESAHLHLDEDGHAPAELGADVGARLQLGWQTTGVEVAAGIAWQRGWRRRVEAAFTDVDVIITPTVPMVAPRADEESLATTARLTSLTYPWSLAGLPSLTVPCGLVDGMPVGMQIAAAPWRDDLVLLVGAAYQAATRWHDLRPPLDRPGNRRHDATETQWNRSHDD